MYTSLKNTPMECIPLKTRAFIPPQDDLWAVLDAHLPKLHDQDILVIASKVLAIHQGRCVSVRDADKSQLVTQEAEHLVLPDKGSAIPVPLAIKNHTLIPFAGIDESNGNGYYILWPQNTDKLCADIRKYLTKKYYLRKLGVLATDSALLPMRRGTVGISIGHAGLRAFHEYRGTKDIFDRTLELSTANVVDSLAAAAVLTMGEGSEQTPLALIRDAKNVEFINEEIPNDGKIPPQEDIYTPLLQKFWE